ncbi:uncharacterized protein RHIMIDRAFT_143967, partial [Rhizopus microsporus ATCC 52813]
MAPPAPPKWATELVNEIKRIGGMMDFIITQNEVCLNVATIRKNTDRIAASLVAPSTTNTASSSAIAALTISHAAVRDNLIAKPKEIKSVVLDAIASVVEEEADPNKIYEDIKRETNNLVNATIEQVGDFVGWTALPRQYRTALLGDATTFAANNGLRDIGCFERNWIIDYVVQGC